MNSDSHCSEQASRRRVEQGRCAWHLSRSQVVTLNPAQPCGFADRGRIVVGRQTADPRRRWRARTPRTATPPGHLLRPRAGAPQTVGVPFKESLLDGVREGPVLVVEAGRKLDARRRSKHTRNELVLRAFYFQVRRKLRIDFSRVRKGMHVQRGLNHAYAVLAIAQGDSVEADQR
jgi:hypothetical protein